MNNHMHAPTHYPNTTAHWNLRSRQNLVCFEGTPLAIEVSRTAPALSSPMDVDEPAEGLVARQRAQMASARARDGIVVKVHSRSAVGAAHASKAVCERLRKAAHSPVAMETATSSPSGESEGDVRALRKRYVCCD